LNKFIVITVHAFKKKYMSLEHDKTRSVYCKSHKTKGNLN